MATYNNIKKLKIGDNVYNLYDSGGTVTSVGVTAGSGISVSGSPITTSGSMTVGHSNSVTAQTTQAVYPIKIDAQGHISAYGSAVTIPDEQIYFVEMGGTVNWPEVVQAVNDGKCIIGKYYDSASGAYYACLAEEIQITNTSSPSMEDYIIFTPSNNVSSVLVNLVHPSWDGNSGWHDVDTTFYGKVWYGTSSTTASTAAKVVTCSDYTLQTGSIIGISFSTANTAATPTLNINSTGAKSIYVGASTPNATDNVLKWSANTMVYFLYDGTYFRYITSVSAGSVVPSRGANTWYGTSSTAATTQAKTSTIDNFVLTKGAVVYITFSTANTYSSAKITLNINSTGAKDVYYNNAVTSSTNTLLWNAGETLIFIYSGSYYYYAGKSITKTSQLINDSGFITTDSDEKLKIEEVEDSTSTTYTYYPILGRSTTTTGIRQIDTDGFQYYNRNGTASAEGIAQLTLGNATASGTEGNKPGTINLYGTTAYAGLIKTGALTASRTYTLPDKTGTVALTSDITGGNYTATSPISIDSSNDISHEDSGVTAGTYDGGAAKNTGFYIPSFTVDSMGHITSATDLGTLIPDVTYSNTALSGVISPYSWSMGLRTYSSYGTIISAGNTTSSITISSDSYSGYTNRTYFRVADVQAYDVSTYEPVIVDWKTDKIYSGGSAITLTVSIASAYTNNIVYFPILTYSIAGM